jgi:hypothetical protein
MRVVASIELSRPALRLLLCSVSFEPSPLFPDVRGAITKDLLEILDTKKWQFDSHDVMVANDDAKRLVTLEPDTLMHIVGDPPADPDELREQCVDAVSAVLGHLGREELSSVAMNLNWHIGVQKGEGLGLWLHEFLGLKAANTFFDAFGGRPNKAETKFEFTPQEDVVVGLEMKPIDADEAADDSFFEDDPAAFPSEAIDLSLWRISGPDDGYALGALGDAWTDSYDRMMRMSERAGLLLTGSS